MPLADERRRVSVVVKDPRKGRQRMALLVARQVVLDPVAVGIQSGEERRPTRGAERRAGKRVQEPCPLGGDPVDVRRFDKRMTACSEIVPSHVVDQDNHDVGARGRFGCTPPDQEGAADHQDDDVGCSIGP